MRIIIIKNRTNALIILNALHYLFSAFWQCINMISLVQFAADRLLSVRSSGLWASWAGTWLKCNTVVTGCWWHLDLHSVASSLERARFEVFPDLVSAENSWNRICFFGVGVEKHSLVIVQMYAIKPMCFCIVSALSTFHVGEVTWNLLL